LNMYKMANDVKSHLILNALSWVDYLRPEICYFENVPGFLNFRFDATQAGKHRVEGGTPMGGLKFLVRAMIDMGYSTQARPYPFLILLTVINCALPSFKQVITELLKAECASSSSRPLMGTLYPKYHNQPTIFQIHVACKSSFQ
jgi:hypothetical protein